MSGASFRVAPKNGTTSVDRAAAREYQFVGRADVRLGVYCSFLPHGSGYH